MASRSPSGQTTTENATLSGRGDDHRDGHRHLRQPTVRRVRERDPLGPRRLRAASANTGPNGSYTITDLPTGSYRLVFRGCSAGDYQTATITGIQATAGQTTTQNASLAPGGAISGHVTDSGANPLAGICVSASPPSPGGQGGSTSTDSSGAYTISGLAPGSLQARVLGVLGGNYAPDTISGVQVSVGQTTTEDISLTAGAIISGQVTDTTANPLAGVCVDGRPRRHRADPAAPLPRTRAATTR